MDDSDPDFSLEHAVACELQRLAAKTHSVESHLEDALCGVELDHDTMTGIQSLDEISQILANLSQLMEAARGAAPTCGLVSRKLVGTIPLVSLRERLQHAEDFLPPPIKDQRIEFF